MSKEPEFIHPDWPAPANVKALTTTRLGGYSEAPFDSFNLSMRAGDDAASVKRNRALLIKAGDLPSEPIWLRQTHGTDVIDASAARRYSEADGSYTNQNGVVCAALTADCCPVFLCDRQGTRVAILHAGWRGLAGGVVEQGVEKLGVAGSDLLAWLGPAIGPKAFEVRDDVYEAFVEKDSNAAEAFTTKENGRWFADIYSLVTQRLNAAGVECITGGSYCTVSDRQRFFSYRRDRVCGHMASVIWLDGVE
ncbi:MAG: peptidoglycan editing factor PgeF [Acidiferrobacterales bacterium]